MQKILLATGLALALSSCGAGAGKNDSSRVEETANVAAHGVVFDADSAMTYLRRQVEFGPRVNNTAAHRQCAVWLEAELRRHGAEVSLQKMKLKDFEGVTLDAVNIIGQYNPEAENRLLLLAHWDTRPWADADPSEENRKTPVDGANDGASGVAVLLEISRQMALKNPGRGVDILFTDAEDRGNHDDEDSWALGTKYFVEHPFKQGYMPNEAILLDMVGGRGAKFYFEAFSAQAAPALLQSVWSIAKDFGYGDIFVPALGGGVTDDHLRLIDAGIPAIDIIEFDPASPNGFNSTWHTLNDKVDNIATETLKAVGQTVINYIYQQQ